MNVAREGGFWQWLPPMAPPRPWTVLPHDPVVTHEDNLKSVTGTLPRGSMNRVMTIARLSDGRLAFHNAVPLEEPAMKALEAWGEPTFLLVPNGYHRLDIHAFKVRYPKLKLLCPAEVAKKVGEVAAVDGNFADFPKDRDVELITLRGGKIGEAVLLVRSGAKTSLAFGDAVMNLPKLPGFEGFVLGLLGSTGKPKVTTIAKLAVVKDKAAMRAHLQDFAAMPGVTRLIPSHGAVIEGNGAQVLGQVAAEL